METLGLEDRFSTVASGSRYNVVADLLTFCPGAHVFQTGIHKQIFHADCFIQQCDGRVTILNAGIWKTKGKIWLKCDDETTVITHAVQGVVTPTSAIEVCSGIGAMGQGLKGCNVITKCYVDYNPRFCKWLRDHGLSGVVEGNISHTSTIIDVATQAPGAQLMVGGVACQPFSRMGDRKEQDDARSESFPAFLRMLYWLQIPIGVMECTSEVLSSPWAQGLLKAFVESTGSNCTQKILHLHRCWPSYRTRWWAVLTQSGIPAMCLEDMPDISFTPGIVHLIPRMLPMPDDELAQLELDGYELRHFHSCKKGVQACIVEKCRPMPTATHSWGSQVVGCLCGCRSNGFSPERLTNQGLHGAVCVLPGYEKLNGEEVSRLRHLHPQEVALLCGLTPSWVPPCDHTPLRLNLAGVGQLASPLQSGWIVGQVIAQLKSCQYPGVHDFSPKKVLLGLIQQLFRERDQLWNVSHPTRYMEIFQSAVTQTCTTDVDDEDEIDFQQELLRSVKVAEDDIANATDDGTPPRGYDDDQSSVDDEMLREFLHRPSSVCTDPYEIALTIDEHLVNSPPCSGVSSPRHVESFADTGGLPGFRTVHSTPHSERASEQPLKRQRVEIPEPEEPHKVTPPRVCPEECQKIPESDDISIQLLKEDMQVPQIVKVRKGSDVQTLIDAEVHLTPGATTILVRDSVGQVIPPKQALHSFQRIHVEQSEDFTGFESPTALSPNHRYGVLTKQGAWVALDEMNVYLAWIQSHHAVKQIPCFVDQIIDDVTVEAWLLQLIGLDPVASITCSAVLKDRHWFPVVAQHSPAGLRVFTTQDGEEWVVSQLSVFKNIEIGIYAKGSDFPNDCGFQTVGWLSQTIDLLQRGQLPADSEHGVMNSAQAEALRGVFEHHLHVNGLAKLVVQPQSMHFGGVSNGTPEDQIRQLLADHGVPPEKLQQRIGMVFEKIGRQGIIQCCRSPRPWQELKSLASALTPKIQLVLPSELAEKIRERVETGASFGDQKKKKVDNKKDQPFPKLLPEDLTVPPAVFKQGRDQPVQQVGLANIGVDASGVVLVSAEQAQPYLKLAKPLSKHGLALLVIDYDNAICSGLGEVLRFPARFNQTNEPIIATARLIQLGQLEVSRHLPTNQIKVEEIKTGVVRAVVYRDELVDQDWQQFVQHPVKYVISHCQHLQQEGQEIGIIDVWDRQFVSSKFDRKKPSEAEVFIVTFRLGGIDCADVLSDSGTAGIYFEPRTQDGRRPDEAYRVTWIPKVDRASAVSAVQASPEWATLVRSGGRFGIRSTNADAAAIHSRHKPNAPFLSSSEVSLWLVGPFPYGATRASLQKVFQQWNWGARPLQPKGRSHDNVGVLWEVQSANRPEFEVYSMEHSDVVIIEAPRKSRGEVKSVDVLASAKTIAMMRQSQSHGTGQSSVSVDPWLKDDPWGSYTPPTKVLKTKPDTIALDSINAAVDRKVAAGLQALEEKFKPGDVPMTGGDDERGSQCWRIRCRKLKLP